MHPPQRIVSLVPSDTHTIAALGAHDRIVGRTTYCEHAPAAPTVGGTKNVDVEAVLAQGVEAFLGGVLISQPAAAPAGWEPCGLAGD